MPLSICDFMQLRGARGVHAKSMRTSHSCLSPARELMLSTAVGRDCGSSGCQSSGWTIPARLGAVWVTAWPYTAGGTRVVCFNVYDPYTHTTSLPHGSQRSSQGRRRAGGRREAERSPRSATRAAGQSIEEVRRRRVSRGGGARACDEM